MNFNRQTIGTLITREGEDRGYFGENLIRKVSVYTVCVYYTGIGSCDVSQPLLTVVRS